MLRTAVLLIALVACRGKAHDRPARTGSGSGSGAGAGAGSQTAAGPKVELRVDGVRVRDVTVDAPIAVSTLAPGEATWVGVVATAADGRFLEVATPATTYPGGRIVLTRESNQVAIAVFRAPATGVTPEVAALANQPVSQLTGVTQLDVWTHAPPVQPSVELTIEIPGRPARELDERDLDSLTEAKEQRAKGWYLRDVVALGRPVGPIESVHVVGETEADISAGQLAALTILKRNQRGQYVVQLWKPGQDRADDQIRGVTKIIVRPRAPKR